MNYCTNIRLFFLYLEFGVQLNCLFLYLNKDMSFISTFHVPNGWWVDYKIIFWVGSWNSLCENIDDVCYILTVIRNNHFVIRIEGESSSENHMMSLELQVFKSGPMIRILPNFVTNPDLARLQKWFTIM